MSISENRVPSGPVRVCIVGASGKLGVYMIEECLERGMEVVGVCRPSSVPKLARFGDRITVVPARTDDREAVRHATQGCQGVLTVLAPWGFQRYASGTAQAVLDAAGPGVRLVFSCGWHITRDRKDVYPWGLRAKIVAFTAVATLTRLADISDQVRACDLIFASDSRWTVVRGSDLEEGPPRGAAPVASARGRSGARLEPDASGRFCALHGARAHGRGAGLRGARHRGLRVAVGPGGGVGLQHAQAASAGLRNRVTPAGPMNLAPGPEVRLQMDQFKLQADDLGDGAGSGEG